MMCVEKGKQDEGVMEERDRILGGVTLRDKRRGQGSGSGGGQGKGLQKVRSEAHLESSSA